MSKDWLSRLRFVFSVLSVVAPATLFAQDQTPSTPPPPVPSAPGLGAIIRPLKVDELSLHEQAQAIPQEKKDRVHFFLINGLDPLYAGNLNGVAAYFRSIGFSNTSCYQFPSTWKVQRKIENLRRSDPEARIVLLGYSVGANCVRSLANSVARDGIQIDCLIYLGGDTVFNTASSKPANVKQIVNITAHGMIFLGRDLYFKGDNIDGAVNHRVDARHIVLPAQRDTINLVGKQIITLASTPAAPPATNTQPAAFEAPAPIQVDPADLPRK